MDERALALEQLYRTRYTGFRNVLATMVGGSEAARDVVQEAFARAYASRGQLRDPGAVEAWVWKIALRTAYERRPAHAPLAGDDLPALLVPERDEAVAEALRSLPPRRRLLVFLHYYADLPYSEVAALCDISEGTVAAALSQARDALRAHLEPEGSHP